VWIQYLSHKVGRLLVPYALITLLAASIELVGQHPFFTLALIAQCTVYVLGGYGAWLERKAHRLRRVGRPAPFATATPQKRVSASA
jgi:hypothetical protein